MGRLASGRGRQLTSIFGDDKPIKNHADRLEVWRHASMAEAVAAGIKTFKAHWRDADKADTMRDYTGPQAMQGSFTTDMGVMLAKADELTETALAADPRLARRAVWRRGEEGDIACPALIAQGDDTPCFYRQRLRTTEANGGEPVRVVISTDSRHVGKDTASAFISAVRLAQQWRSVEVWWQGAWLNDAGNAGWVFHVPLIQGDMDFARLEFCLNNGNRDALSWAVMIARNAATTRTAWGGCAGTGARSYLPEAAHFVRHTGITPDGESIARHAAAWLGWEEPVSEVSEPVAVDFVAKVQADVAEMNRLGNERRQKEAIAEAERKATNLSRTY